jgi:hypothetical protein
MKAKEDLIKYAPSQLLGLIIKETDPLYYPYLCSINERIAGLLGRKAGSSSCKELPYPIGVERDLLLFKQVYYDNDLHMYGTSHIRKVLVDSGRERDVEELDELCKISLERRKRELKAILKEDNIAGNFNVRDFSKYALNIWISPDTFTSLLPVVKKIQRRLNSECLNSAADRESLLRGFVNEILKYDDYVINWGYFQILFRHSEEWPVWQQDEVIIEFIQNVVKDIRRSLIMRIDYDLFAPVVGVGAKRAIKDGTLFYRGYRTYKGATDIGRNHVWLTFDVISSMNYLVPPVKEDSKRITTQTVLFSDSHDYCAGAGGVAVFRVKRDLEVLDFANVDTIRHLNKVLKDEKAPEDVIKAFEHGWAVGESGEIDRYSVDRYDFIVVNWLCQKGYGGYIAVGIKGLHDEILLCDPSDTLDYVGDYDPRKDMNFHVCQKPYTLMNTTLLYF